MNDVGSWARAARGEWYVRVMKKIILRIGQSHAKEASVCHQVCNFMLQSLEERLCWGMRVLRAVDILELVDA